MPHLTPPADAFLPPRLADAPLGIVESNHCDACFGCRQDIGLRMEIDFSSEYCVTGKFFVTEVFQGGPGVLHGGLLSLAFDEVMGSATRLVTSHAVTGTLEITYQQPVFIRQEITIQAQVLGMLRRKIYVSAEAFIPNNPDPVGTARAIFISINAIEHYTDAVMALQAQQTEDSTK